MPKQVINFLLKVEVVIICFECISLTKSSLLILLLSTMQKENQQRFIGNQLCQTIQVESKCSYESSQKSIMDFLGQLLSLQYQVNRTLLINNILADQFIKQMDETNGKNSSSEGSTLVSGRSKIELPKDEKRPHDEKKLEKKKKQRVQSRDKQLQSASQYEPSQQQQAAVQYKLSESKNVPKNYGKSILSFIKKNQSFTNRVLDYFGKDIQKFHLFLAKFKNNINTIKQLRSLWIEDFSNQFAIVLRVISCQYLRKHSLSHIFNSRVQNFGKHVKYRQKILKAIRKPQQFTQMKDY